MAWREWTTAAALALLVLGCVEKETDQPSAADWQAIRNNLLASAPTMQYPVNADLEGKVVYLGLNVAPRTIVPGQPFTLTHYWKVLKPVPGWETFFHLQDPGRKKYINADHRAIEGRYPAAMWKPGEIIRDVQRVTLPPDWPADRLNVYTGLWRGSLRLKPSKANDGKNRILAASIPVRAGTASSRAQAGPRLVALRAAGPIKIDGRLDEPSWAKAQATDAFVDTMTGAAGAVRTVSKVLWDDKMLYVAFECEDRDVWSSFHKRDDHLWTQEAVELFIDANGDQRDYIELQVAPTGAIFDSYLSGYRANDDAWNSGIKAAVQVDGTLNQRKDEDRGWTVELALPLTDVKGKGSYALRLPPQPGDVWRVNMFRLDMPSEKRQVAVGWSPPLVGDFHKLDRFGQLVFADASGSVVPAGSKAAIVPADRASASPGAAAKPVVAKPAATASSQQASNAASVAERLKRIREMRARLERDRPSPTAKQPASAASTTKAP